MAKKLNASHQLHAAKIVSATLKELERLTKPGVSLDHLDEVAKRIIEEMGGRSYNFGYKPAWAPVPYPATICASVDEEVCHAPPGGRELKEGQIVIYDIGVKFLTAVGDAALTVPVGKINKEKRKLIKSAKRALYAGINEVKAGVKVRQISEAIEKSIIADGFKPIKQFSGHGIGDSMHEDPMIPNYVTENVKVEFTSDKSWEERLKYNKTICIEPMVTSGNAAIGMMGDGWTAFTLDEKPVAMFEHMISVRENSYEILTDHIINDG